MLFPIVIVFSIGPTGGLERYSTTHKSTTHTVFRMLTPLGRCSHFHTLQCTTILNFTRTPSHAPFNENANVPTLSIVVESWGKDAKKVI